KFAAWIGALPDADARQFRHMILYLLFPDSFERIFGGGHRKAIVQTFSGKPETEVEGMSPIQLDQQLASIREAQQAKYPDQTLDFYTSPLKEKWRPEASDPAAYV